jgi:hypothetical protein
MFAIRYAIGSDTLFLLFMSQTESVAPTESASCAGSGPERAKKGEKLAYIKHFFDLPASRTVGAKFACKLCRKLVVVQKSSYYNFEKHCLNNHISLWERVLAGGKLSDSATPLQSEITSSFEKSYSEGAFREELWKWVIDDEQSHLVCASTSKSY